MCSSPDELWLSEHLSHSGLTPESPMNEQDLILRFVVKVLDLAVIPQHIVCHQPQGSPARQNLYLRTECELSRTKNSNTSIVRLKLNCDENWQLATRFCAVLAPWNVGIVKDVPFSFLNERCWELWTLSTEVRCVEQWFAGRTLNNISFMFVWFHSCIKRCNHPRVRQGLTEMIGVEIFFDALIISLILGTPRVTFIAATPAKWNVLSVIWVPGSPILCAPNAPTVDPATKWNSS